MAVCARSYVLIDAAVLGMLGRRLPCTKNGHILVVGGAPLPATNASACFLWPPCVIVGGGIPGLPTGASSLRSSAAGSVLCPRRWSPPRCRRRTPLRARQRQAPRRVLVGASRPSDGDLLLVLVIGRLRALCSSVESSAADG